MFQLAKKQDSRFTKLKFISDIFAKKRREIGWECTIFKETKYEVQKGIFAKQVNTWHIGMWTIDWLVTGHPLYHCADVLYAQKVVIHSKSIISSYGGYVGR